MKSFPCKLAVLFAVISAAALAEPPASKPSTQPAAGNATAKVSPEARKLLGEMKDAYAKLTSLELSGTTSFDSDISGKKDHQSDAFNASFAAPNKFRHEMKGNMIAGSTGEKMYVLSVEDNAYAQKDAPKDRVASGDAPKVVWDVVTMQNPSLALAMAHDAGAQLIENATAFALGAS